MEYLFVRLRKLWTQPVFALFALGAFVLVLRPPLPVDETRYLEVARELSPGAPLTLHLNGEPYAHKPPLAFWVAGALETVGIPISISLRLLPAVAAALTAWLVGRLAQRAGIRHAGWLYASMLLPLAYTQVLLIDPLLTLVLWWSLFEWSRGRDGLATLAAALAFMAKGPVAALYLLPMGCALAGLREVRPKRSFMVAATLALALSAVGVASLLAELSTRWGDATQALAGVWWTSWAIGLVALVALVARRGQAWGASLALVVLGGALVMVVWALASALQGGEEFANELLVHQTGGRVVNSFAHSRPALFYLPVLLLGSLPATPLFFMARPHGIARRLLLAAAVSLAVLMAIDGKQPHYMLPLFPALALACAQVLQERERAVHTLRTVAAVFLAVLGLAWVLGPLVARHQVVARFGPSAKELLGLPMWWSMWAAGGLTCASAVVALTRSRAGVQRVSLTFLLGCAAIAWPAHYALGRLTTPQKLEARLQSEPAHPLALYQCFQGGYFNWISGRERVARLDDVGELLDWCASHPGGWVLQATASVPQTTEALLVDELVDYYRGREYSLRQIAGPGSTSGRPRPQLSALVR